MALFIQHAKTHIPTFAGIKWAASDLAGLLRCKALHGDSIALMWANDDVLLGALAVGIRSFNGTTYSFSTKTARSIVDAYKRGDTAGAAREQLYLKTVVDLLEEDGNWLQRHKAILEFLTGIPTGPARLPLPPLTDAAIKKLTLDYTKLYRISRQKKLDTLIRCGLVRSRSI
ncbi:hypothetical protein BV898_19933 [Hypsibius exemplaris]|uniref:N-acetylneuraminate lyase n=1 Tax=Hypsibius exemplaris TaxID=2072580 RepID=A0A9X6RPE3_HYPEX|nr:hypothetical protein BV898_19933 [Hypsibius exemplaris]